ncbi:MAG TPA: hypothetical protein DIC36_09950, partial [Gammaproteobacteria bacterium]|nr:hypothetical protein [Gammaproteobacteria bacterium]
ANKTNFCTMGAVSDWVNMGDTSRMRMWLLAIAVAVLGANGLQLAGVVDLSKSIYLAPNFTWLSYIVGGFLFGVGMTLGSGCGSKTLIRIGGGNIKSIFVLAIASVAAYWMLWGDIKGEGFYDVVFGSWINPTIVNLSSQELGAIVASMTGGDAASMHFIVGSILAVAVLVYVFKSADFRGNFDNILGGLVVGLVVVAGWYITGGTMGAAWKDYADLSVDIPSRVNVQSFTFISPMGDSVRYLMHPTNFTLLNFGIMAVSGVVVGSFLYSLFTRKFRIEWFASGNDFLTHATGGLLMGFGGVLSMGCTIGQGVTGISTLALGSILTFASIVFGSALTMKVQYYQLDEQGFLVSLRSALADMRLLPRQST